MKHGKEIGHRKSVFDPCLILGCLVIQIYILHGAQRSRRLVEIHTDEIGGAQFLCICVHPCASAANFEELSLMMPSLPAPKAILFDLGDTVLREVDYHPLLGITQLFEDRGLRAGVDLETARSASLTLLTEIRAKRDSEITEFPFQSWLRLIVDQFCGASEISLADAELEFWTVSARMEPQPGIAALLAWLAERKIPLGIVSNAMFSTRLLSGELARHSLKDAFQFVMSSADYGVQKPHPAIFRAAAARLGFQSPEIWFVGDDYHKDVLGARNAGMNAVWYNPRQASVPKDDPTMQISDWAAFPALIAVPPATRSAGDGGRKNV